MKIPEFKFKDREVIRLTPEVTVDLARTKWLFFYHQEKPMLRAKKLVELDKVYKFLKAQCSFCELFAGNPRHANACGHCPFKKYNNGTCFNKDSIYYKETSKTNIDNTWEYKNSIITIYKTVYKVTAEDVKISMINLGYEL